MISLQTAYAFVGKNENESKIMYTFYPKIINPTICF